MGGSQVNPGCSGELSVSWLGKARRSTAGTNESVAAAESECINKAAAGITVTAESMTQDGWSVIKSLEHLLLSRSKNRPPMTHTQPKQYNACWKTTSRRTLSALTNTNPNFTTEIDHFQTDKQTDAQTNNERFILNTPLLIAADNTVCPPPKVAADPPPLKKRHRLSYISLSFHQHLCPISSHSHRRCAQLPLCTKLPSVLIETHGWQE